MGANCLWWFGRGGRGGQTADEGQAGRSRQGVTREEINCMSTQRVRVKWIVMEEKRRMKERKNKRSPYRLSAALSWLSSIIIPYYCILFEILCASWHHQDQCCVLREFKHGQDSYLFQSHLPFFNWKKRFCFSSNFHRFFSGLVPMLYLMWNNISTKRVLLSGDGAVVRAVGRRPRPGGPGGPGRPGGPGGPRGAHVLSLCLPGLTRHTRTYV